VTADTTPVVYFTQGHSERDIAPDYKYLSQALDRNNFDVKSINITTIDKIPEDAQILAFPDPQTDIYLILKPMRKIKKRMSLSSTAKLLIQCYSGNIMRT
jgi:hypothetical protein